MAYTSADLITAVKRLATIPDAGGKTFTEAQLLLLADQQLTGYIVPLIKRHMGDYGLFSQDVALVAGKAKYRIPYRAIGDNLQDVKYVDAAGNEQQMIKVEGSDPAYRQIESGVQPYGYIVEANSLILKPTPSATGTIRLRYFIRPNRLVNVGQAGTVASIAGQVIVVTGPLGWTSGGKYDAIKSTPGFEHVLVDLKPVAFVDSGTGTYTITAGTGVDLSDLEVGDYFCKAEETPVPQIPADLHTILYQRLAIRIQELQGDALARKNAQEEWALIEASVSELLAPRVETARMTLNTYLRDHLI